ncbi:hypothetical protein D3C87_296060 [compost metagenome]
MGEDALLARHSLASVRTHSRQRLGQTAERDLQRVPGTHPPPSPVCLEGNRGSSPLAPAWAQQS